MAVDLNKKIPSVTYYYSDENINTLGPFTLEQLLPKIKKNTLVYREGINWTNADQVEELKIYFNCKYLSSASLNRIGGFTNRQNFFVFI